MKKHFFAAIALIAVISLYGCGTTIPVNESSAPFSESVAESAAVTSSSSENVSFSEEASAGSEISEAESSAAEESSKEEQPSEQASEPVSEPVSEPASEEPVSETETSQPAVIGNLFKPYLTILSGKNYMVKTVESRIVGGEAMPYTTCVYHKGGDTYVTIEESYGAVSEFIISGGYIYWLDDTARTASKAPYSEDIFTERSLYSGSLSYTGNETMKIFDSSYTCETYTDSEGNKIYFCFSAGSGILKYYKYYDPVKKDTIMIDINISADISGGVFEVPDGYTVNG